MLLHRRRYEPAKIQLEGWVRAFAKYHDIRTDEARDVASKYALSQHILPSGTTSNLVRTLPLKPFDDTDPAWMHTVMKNVTKAETKGKIGQVMRQVSFGRNLHWTISGMPGFKSGTCSQHCSRRQVVNQFSNYSFIVTFTVAYAAWS